MNRRSFLRQSGLASLSWSVGGLRPPIAGCTRLLDAQSAVPDENVNWASPEFRPLVKASSYAADPPWGYVPQNVLGDNLFMGWQASGQSAGAWLEIQFKEPRLVSEIWILPEPLPRDIRGQEVYMLVYSREQLLESPRHVRIDLSNTSSVTAELRRAGYFQIVSLPSTEKASSLRITVEDVWPKPGGQETGLGKIRVYSRKHAPEFQIDVRGMYDAQSGRPTQSATLHLINPDDEIRGGELKVSHQGSSILKIPLQPIPRSAATQQDIWIPAPLEDTEMEYEVASTASDFCCKRSLRVPSYHSYFDGGTFSLNCTCHNDLGWLDDQVKTADFRSAEIIMPALELLKKHPGFLYSMESTTYLMEFLERHPERREELTAFMRSRRFTWGASYIQCQEVHVGPEKLVRQYSANDSDRST